MDFILKDFSVGFFALQLVFLLNIPLVIWAVFCLIKSKKQNTSIKLLVLISLIAFPIVSSLIYLSDYYSKDIKERML